MVRKIVLTTTTRTTQDTIDMRAALDMYDDMPKYMRKYLQNYGWHFNKALCSYAISFMKKGGKSLEPVSKEYIDKVLT